MSPITALVAEDEPLLQAELADALHALWPELSIVGRASDGIEALRLFLALRPSVLFLDIEMPGLSGLEVAKQATAHAHIVFVTAYDQYALAAFDQGALDYVVKPLSIPRMSTTVQRLKARVTEPPPDHTGAIAQLELRPVDSGRYLRWINASIGGTVNLITVQEICYFQADAKYTLVVTPNAEALIRKSIRELTDELDPNLFWKIHRSTLVNVNSIASVSRDDRGHLRLQLKYRSERLAVSESYAHLFRQM
ncbi:MAG TPA: LytTR family DNA-binding domain-containing protein [Casimicrobiaceae bacterium]|jgi:DNA-binding LytR/AlgR family response regulator|nr:LytTR family DNA-binding domain-containing protein [Casimicrobiaceae bacterium]